MAVCKASYLPLKLGSSTSTVQSRMLALQRGWLLQHGCFRRRQGRLESQVESQCAIPLVKWLPLPLIQTRATQFFRSFFAMLQNESGRVGIAHDKGCCSFFAVTFKHVRTRCVVACCIAMPLFTTACVSEKSLLHGMGALHYLEICMEVPCCDCICFLLRR